ncbi:uncharacterized protein LOC118511974 isoform X1 [Anopheles stephensi]|uniref:uncharacterized protein LOC118511974 isoform X1 n=1 Tax=Anopheles stephensi TaxID=30069 RepID=UPI0016589B08|nr:uncharacterized protein LOC118511974 isoform X1 [Anopheles stephensi]
MFREAANTNRSLKSCTLSALRSRLPQLTIRPNKVVIQAASITPTSKTSPRINVTAAPTKATTSAIPSRLLPPNSFKAASAKATTSAIPSRLLPPNSFKAASAKATTSAIPSRMLPPNANQVLTQLQPKQQPHSTILCSSIHVKYIDQHPPLKSRHHPSSMQLLRKKNEMC